MNTVDAASPPILRVTHALPGEADVGLRAELPYAGVSGGANCFDMYCPAGDSANRRPLALVVFGVPDAAMERVIGARLKNTTYLQS